MRSEDAHARLGESSLKIEGFQLWVHGRQFPDSHDRWDGNWLNNAAHCGAAGASIWVSGAILTTMDIEDFLKGCERLYAQMTDEAILHSLEPNLSVSLRATDRLGHVEMRVEITPDHLTQKHQLTFAIDQSYLPAIVSQCEKILEEFPVRA